MKKLFVPVLGALALVPAQQASASPDHFPPAAKIAGVAVGGLGPYGARVELERQLAPVYESPVTVRIRNRRFKLTTSRLGQKVLYLDMVRAGYEQFQHGDPVHVMTTGMSAKHTAAPAAAQALPLTRRTIANTAHTPTSAHATTYSRATT